MRTYLLIFFYNLYGLLAIILANSCKIRKKRGAILRRNAKEHGGQYSVRKVEAEVRRLSLHDLDISRSGFFV